MTITWLDEAFSGGGGSSTTASAVDWAPTAAPHIHAPSQQIETTTTDATVATALTFTHADESVADYTATVLGRSDDNRHFRLDLRVAYASTGGTFTTLDGPSTSNGLAANPGAWSAVFDRSGSSVRVRVTGETGHTIRWSVIADAQVAGITAAGWTMATLPLTLWFEQAFSGSPWTSTASAGTSGGRTATEATHPPTAGVTLGGKVAAAFTTNELLTVAGGLTLANIVSAGAGGVMILYRANAGQAADAGVATSDANLLCDSGANFAIGVNASGLSVFLYDGGSKFRNVAATHDGSTWNAAFVRFDGSLLELGVNHGAMSTTAAGAIAGTTGTVKIGANYNSTAFFPGQIREIVTFATKPSDTDRANIIAAWNAAYGLSL